MILPAKPDEGKWASMTLTAQMANLGSEVGRTSKWISKGKEQMAESAFIRALDLFDLTIKYARLGLDNRNEALKELCYSRELFTKAYLEKNIHELQLLDKYFYHFSVANNRLKTIQQ